MSYSEMNKSSYHHNYFPDQLNSFFLTVVNENFSINEESVISEGGLDIWVCLPDHIKKLPELLLGLPRAPGDVLRDVNIVICDLQEAGSLQNVFSVLEVPEGDGDRTTFENTRSCVHSVNILRENWMK